MDFNGHSRSVFVNFPSPCTCVVLMKLNELCIRLAGVIMLNMFSVLCGANSLNKTQ